MWQGGDLIETNALRRRCPGMTARQRRLIELIDRLQAALDELREAVRQEAESSADRDAIEAFADESFRARDA